MSTKKCTVDGCDSNLLTRGWCRKHYSRWYETGSLHLGVRKGNYGPRPERRRPIQDRFWEKVEKTETCWLWTGTRNGQGYGAIWSADAGKHLMAHRVSWELHNGPIQGGLHIDHLCRVPRCVRPGHLEPVTLAENVRRGYAPSLGAAAQLAKTHCPQGHPYDEENTYINKRGGRMCRTCLRVRTRAQAKARKEGIRYVDPFILGASN